MPRDSQGLYTLPAGNPVSTGTLIESDWANGTMADLAQAMTDSLPRSGAAPMVGPLTLSGLPPTAARHATSKAYVDQFVAYATGLPIGSIVAYAAGTAPGGFILCNGGAVSRTTYAALFALIGTTYGPGDNVSTFNVPNLQDQFIRGRNPSTRAVGSAQTSAFGNHNHPTNDPGHIHTVTDPPHNHLQDQHSHAITQTAHTHPITTTNGALLAAGNNSSIPNQAGATGSGLANITINNEIATNQATASGVTIASVTTGVTNGAVGDTETRPVNMAMDYYIKALSDSAGPPGVLNITSSDEQIISIDSTNPTAPILNIHSNVAYGVVKLDGSNKIPPVLLPAGNQNLLGMFDASTGNNPSQTYPTYVFLNGDTFIISDPGTILLIDPNTGLPAPIAVNAGNQLTWIVGSGLAPTGWYYVIATVTSVTASGVSFVPSGSITATDVQNGIQQLDTLKAPKASPIFTGTVQGITAAMIVNTPFGNIGATNVQLAINELESEKVALNGSNVVASSTWNINILGNSATSSSTTGNAGTATNPAGGGTFVTSLNIGSQAVASAAVSTYAKQVPTSANATGTLVAGDAGKCLDVAIAQTVPATVLSGGDIVSVFNNSAAPILLNQGVGVTLRLAGTATTGNRTIAAYGMATIWFASPTVAVCSGPGVS